MKKVLIADNHPLMRDAIRTLFEGQNGFEVVGEVGDTDSCIFQIEQVRPDILALDLNMPSAGGFSVMQHVADKQIDVQIFIFSMHSGPEFVARARDLGARGFVAKEDVGHEFLAMLKSGSTGFLMSSSAGRAQPLEYLDDVTDQDTLAQIKSLTHSELQVLKHLCNSRTSAEISDQLGLSVRTIHAHRHNMSQKLGISGANKLMAFAIENKSLIQSN